MLQNVTFELSLKAFKKVDDCYIEVICRKMFSQWNNLIKEAKMVSVMLWASDGSEILEYRGEMDQPFEWCKYIGGANPEHGWNKEGDPDGIGLHAKNHLYIDNPHIITYGILKKIVGMLKKIGSEVTGGKTIRVGTIFDPGPEFAKSDFKYKKHREICLGESLGGKSFVCCYGVLHKDDSKYAGFLDGIPEGTSFGTFLGRQSEIFLKDMGYDYLWLSNGFGFGTEPWVTNGAIFDGENFNIDKLPDVKDKIINFWKSFREECPEIRLESRGTNFSVGIDLATDGVPIRDIYNGGFNMLPPPNSPWAALNGDFGLELIGYMSRISELPDEDFLFRYYINDPWWMTTPWIDQYQRQPHDIYLPLAITRVDGKGDIFSPSYMNILTVDDTLGNMPDICPNEVIPHLLEAMDNKPDRVSPVVWVYPFNEYCDKASESENAIKELFFGDWFMRGAINTGLPLSTIVSTGNYVLSSRNKPDLYDKSVLVSVVPQKGSEYERAIIDWIKSGGKVLFYGPVNDASAEFLDLINIALDSEITGELSISLHEQIDETVGKPFPDLICHRSLTSAGGINTVLKNENDEDSVQLATFALKKGENRRVGSVYRGSKKWNGGATVWVRGTCSNYYVDGQNLLEPDNADELFIGESLMRYALKYLGYEISFVMLEPSVKSPVTMISCNNNALYFSGYVPNTTATIKLKFPLGAPLMIGCEAQIKDGKAIYHMPRSWRRECRIFIEQEENGIVSCNEKASISYEMRRKISVTGLKNATLRIFPEKGSEDVMDVLLNSPYPFVIGEDFDGEWINSIWGKYFEIRNVTGDIIAGMPFSNH